MSFRELSMIDVREVLRRFQAGQSARQLARESGVDRKTAKRYIEAAKELGVTTSSELTDELVTNVARRVQVRPELPPSEAWAMLSTHRPRIEAWLGGPRPLRLIRVGELLAREGIQVGYTTLRRFAHEELGWRERPSTVRVDDPPPGEEAQIDFGEMGYVTDIDGKRRKLWVLVVTLSMSRYTFVWPTFSQTLASVCDGLDAAWRFFGGIAKRVVLDNMAAAVVRAHRTDPTLNRSFVEYAQVRGFFIDPARVRRPQDKPRVENQVAYVRERWFDGDSHSSDISEIRASAERWSRDIAGTRIHGTTRRVPRDVYQTEECQHMLPPPKTPFDVPVWSQAKVHPDHHAQVARSLYSLPTRLIGKRLEVRTDRTTVRFYLGSELVKVHQRVAPGKRSTDATDYPVGKADYALRSVDGLKSRGREHGEHVGAYIDRLLAGPLPWIRMRQAYALLRLCDRYGAPRVDALCARSLAFDVVDVGRIERMLKSAQKTETEGITTGKLVSLPTIRFARAPSHFATVPNTASELQKGGA